MSTFLENSQLNAHASQRFDKDLTITQLEVCYNPNRDVYILLGVGSSIPAGFTYVGYFERNDNGIEYIARD